MTYHVKDRVYGTIDISNTIILELIKTTPFQRLKGINQYGGVNFVYPEYQVSRYEHSIGVWYILHTLGASLEVQVAGLLHDIGHTAFSHMVDHALRNDDENFHEHNLHYINNYSEIEEVLKKYRITLQPVENYPEIKKKMPYIGADRLDYAVRDYIGATKKKKSLGRKILENTVLINHSIVFTNQKVAKEYALTGLEGMWLGIYDNKVAVVYQALVEMLRTGLQEGWITIKDLYTDDKTVFQKFIKNKNKLDPKSLLIFNKSFTVAAGTKEDYDFKHVKNKLRYFDPPLLVNNKKVGLSTLDEDFAMKMNKMLNKFNKAKTGNYLKIIFK